MERAARLLNRIKSKSLSMEDFARAAWPKAVGTKLDRRTRVIGMVRETLVIEVEDAVWQRQLNALRGYILTNLAGALGPGVTDLEFRIGVPRRPPQPELESASTAPAGDEADRIADPALRHLYRRSRNESGAGLRRKAAGA